MLILAQKNVTKDRFLSKIKKKICFLKEERKEKLPEKKQ